MSVHASESQTPHKGSPRRRLPVDWNVRNFIDWANENKIAYVVLRWFENLPDINEGDDIDVLVADDDVHQVLSVVADRGTIGIPIDLYTPSGRMGTKYKGVPYYPPHIAENILNNSQLYRGCIPVPKRDHYFYSLAYHAVYHKGRRSDLSKSRELRREPQSSSKSNHSHFETLCSLREELSIDVRIDFSSLADFLHEHGWEPGFDLLRKLGESNGWVRELYERRASALDSIEGLGVFILRKWSIRKGWPPKILIHLQQAGLKIVAVHELTDERRLLASTRLRGGNWGATREFPVNAGGPAMLIAVLDPDPKPVSDADRKQYPHMSNGRIIRVKRELRNMMNQGRQQNALVNALHTSDDEIEATYYLKLIVPELVPVLRDISLTHSHSTTGALENTSTGTRSKWHRLGHHILRLVEPITPPSDRRRVV